MPQRVFRGSGDSVFPRKKSDNSLRELWEGLTRAPRGSKKSSCRASRIEGLESRTLLSTSWFVSPSGSDQNAGSISAPFKTIQHAATIAQAGDHVEIRAGTYHETVTPVHSGTAAAPIVFEAYNGENVTISGADAVTGWSSYKGQIYDASMPWTLGEGNDQVFVDGRMINEARFPNTSLDVSHPTLAYAQSVTIKGSIATLYDPALSQPAGYWAGAIIHITPGQAWIAQTGNVISSAPGSITYKFVPLDAGELPKAGNSYYLTGTFKGLDGSGEWFRDSTGKLYAWTPAGDSPAAHDVEAKHRLYAFDVSGESYVTIQNVNIFAATIRSNSSSTGLVVNHISARYVGQFLSTPHGWDVPDNSGLLLAGNSSVLENSTIAYGAGDGVLVTGGNSRVSNNVIHDVDYTASDTAAIRIVAVGVEADHNTIYNAGRSGILHEAGNLKILYNVVHDVGLQTTEAGGIYTVHTNGQGTEIAYNKIYNMHSGGFGQSGLFLDNNSSNFVVDHNQVWNVDHALKLNYICRNDKVFNNTLDGTQSAVLTNGAGDWQGTTLTKNVFGAKTKFTPGGTETNNATTPTVGLGAGDFDSGASAATVNVGPPASTGGGTTTPPTSGSGNPSSGGSSGSGSGTGSSGTGSGSATGSGSGTGSGSATGNGSGTGSGSGTGTESGSGSNSGTGGTPAPTPTLPPVTIPVPVVPPDYLTLLTTDRAAIAAAKLARGQHLVDLATTLRSDQKAYRTALSQLRVARHVARRASKSSGSVATSSDVLTLTSAVTSLLQTIAADRAALAAAHHADFTGIASARKALSNDQKAYHKSKHAK